MNREPPTYRHSSRESASTVGTTPGQLFMPPLNLGRYSFGYAKSPQPPNFEEMP